MKVRNELLLALPSEACERVLAEAELVQLRVRQVLHERLQPIPDVYFPEEGGISVQVRLPGDHERAGLGIFGRRGMVGLPVVLGASTSPLRAVVIQPGSAWRVRADMFKTLMSEPLIGSVMLRYAQARLVQMAQLDLCNSCHSVGQRICRWLLVTSYLTDSRDLPFSHEQIARMVSVRRPTTSETLGRLSQNGWLEQRRGLIRVLDPGSVETVACRCHKQIIAELDRALAKPSQAGRANTLASVSS